jgi:hypothetical protein
MTNRPDSVNDKASHVADSLKNHGTKALSELHDDLKGMSAGQRHDFFHNLQSSAGGHKLPGLEIHEDSKHNLKVSENGQGHGKHVLYDEAKESKAPGKQDAPISKAPESPTNPPTGDKSHQNNGDQFSSGLKKGEGPYQALQRQHPDWDHQKLKEESKKIKEQTGRNSFKQGEQFKSNDDGSVTSRENDHQGNFSETTQKNGKTSDVRSGDAKGNWTSKSYDETGKETKSTVHTAGNDGTYSEIQRADGKVTSTVSTDKTGKNTATFDKDTNKTSAMRENNDGSAVGWKKNSDGSMTTIDQPDKNHSTETTTKDGTTINTKTHEQSADGSKDVITDDKGNNTNVYDKSGNQSSAMRNNNDGTAIGWRKNSDGSTTSVDQSDKNHWTETTQKDGKTLSTKTHEPLADGSKETTTDNNGKNVNTFDGKGNQTSGIRENNDKTATGWYRNTDGGTTHFDRDTKGHSSETAFDSKGHISSTTEREASGEFTAKKYANGQVTTQHRWKGRGGVTEETITKAKGDAPTGPDA